MRPNSYARYLRQLDRPERASRYPSHYNNSLRQRRELQCLRQLIALVPPHSRVLDLPSGTGRVTRLILEAGHRVLAGDSAPQMLAEAERQLASQFPQATFQVMTAAETGLPEQSVDAVTCNRLFHHFAEREVRVNVLREFARVSRGLVIVSFSNSCAADVLWQRSMRRLRGRELTHYFPISMREFKDEFSEAGLAVVATRAVLKPFSRMWYVVGRPARLAEQVMAALT